MKYYRIASNLAARKANHCDSVINVCDGHEFPKGTKDHIAALEAKMTKSAP
jgi:hypothetical protein